MIKTEHLQRQNHANAIVILLYGFRSHEAALPVHLDSSRPRLGPEVIKVFVIARLSVRVKLTASRVVSNIRSCSPARRRGCLDIDSGPTRFHPQGKSSILRVASLLGLWIFGSLGHWVFWVSGSLGLWVSGSLGLWVSGSLGLWVSGSLGLWVSRASRLSALESSSIPPSPFYDHITKVIVAVTVRALSRCLSPSPPLPCCGVV